MTSYEGSRTADQVLGCPRKIPERPVCFVRLEALELFEIRAAVLRQD
jgi:hypothetical protein